MKALLMHRNRNFDLQQAVPWNVRDLTQDLELNTLLQAMSSGDEFLFDVARKALLSGSRNDVETILYRQAVLRDCLNNPAAIKELYDLVVETIQATRKQGWGLSSHYPSSLLYSAVEMLEVLSGRLMKLRSIGEETERFDSEAFAALFAMLRKELSDEYMAGIRGHLTELKLRKGVLVSAELGEWNEAANYVLRPSRDKDPNWFERLFGKGPPGHTFYLHPRDEAGARILSDISHRGISRVAIALAQSADHVLNFFKMLRTELAFYVGCLNLYERLSAKQEPVCFPTPVLAGERTHHFDALYDVCLSLQMEHRIVGNAADADGKRLIIITGANQGGKSSFLRSIGLAQLMMECGMFVGAEYFAAELCPALFTHYKREEDATMNRGKLDEELSRLNEIVDHIAPDSMLLFNESFAATNEREGSEIANQVVRALLEKRMKILYVTHLYDFARSLFERKTEDAVFLRAERKADGTRTFKVLEGEPLETSFGEDVYCQVFDSNGKSDPKSSNTTTPAVAD